MGIPSGSPGGIGDGLSVANRTSDSIEVVNVGEVHPDQLVGLDLLLVGSPTRGSGHHPQCHEFFNRIPSDTLAGVKVGAFDTRADMDKLAGASRFFGKIFDHFGYAAPRILSSLEKKGGQAIKPTQGFIVLDKEGPLAEGELARATEWARQFVAQRQSEEVH